MSKKTPFLSNPKYLFTILTAVVKKYGSTLTLTKEDLLSVTKNDLVTLVTNPKDQSITFTVIPGINLQDDEEYEN
tara:strand:+ start:583 stop:807 length:225 start_codon:yes stop_codon:yes gene_type:complete